MTLFVKIDIDYLWNYFYDNKNLASDFGGDDFQELV